MVQADASASEMPEQSPSERCTRAFAYLWKYERARSERCLSDIADILLDREDHEPLTSRERRIVDRFVAYLERADDRVTAPKPAE